MNSVGQPRRSTSVRCCRLTPLCLSVCLHLSLAGPLAGQGRAPLLAVSEVTTVPREGLTAIQDRVRGWVAEDRLVGAELLVLERGHPLLHEAFGWKDREAGIRMERNTLFNIRSMTKPLVGTVARILMEEGSLSPEDPVADYLPAFGGEPTQQINVGQLLTHSSGLPVTLGWAPGSFEGSLQDLAMDIARAGPEFTPGSRFWYSDSGFDILGAVLEAATGMSLDQLLNARLFQPLGMADTGFLFRGAAPEIPVERISSLYGGTAGAWEGFWHPADPPLYPFPLGSQGIYSTPSDYARFLDLWLRHGEGSNGRILRPETVEKILTPTARMTLPGSASRYPSGFSDLEVWHGEMSMLWVEEVPPDLAVPETPSRIIGYSGSDGTFAWAWPAEDLMVLLFTQSRGQDIQIEMEQLLATVTSEEAASKGLRWMASPSQASSGDAEDPEDLERFAGRYRTEIGSTEGQVFVVRAKGGRLTVEIPGQGAFPLKVPDAEGWRPFTVTDQVAVRFTGNRTIRPDGESRFMIMELAQTSVFPLKASLDPVPTGVPPHLMPFLGEYLIPGGQGVLRVDWGPGGLTLTDPNQRRMLFSETGIQGTWHIQDASPKDVSFQEAPGGGIQAMELREVVRTERVGG